MLPVSLQTLHQRSPPHPVFFFKTPDTLQPYFMNKWWRGPMVFNYWVSVTYVKYTERDQWGLLLQSTACRVHDTLKKPSLGNHRWWMLLGAAMLSHYFLPLFFPHSPRICNALSYPVLVVVWWMSQGCTPSEVLFFCMCFLLLCYNPGHSVAD